MEMKPYIVYVKPNSDSYITAVNSSAFLTDTTDWVEIDRGHGDKFHHAQRNYFSKPIFTWDRAYRYKLVDGVTVECTAEEIAQQEAANQPSKPQQNLEQRVTTVESDVASLTAAIEKGLSL